MSMNLNGETIFSAEGLVSKKEFAELQRRMDENLALTFAANIDAFREFMPEIAAVFENFVPKRSMQFVCMENGQINLYFPDSGDFLYPTADPLAFAKKQITEQVQQNAVRMPMFQSYPEDGEFELHVRYARLCLDRMKSYTKCEIEQEDFPIPNCFVFGTGLGYLLDCLLHSFTIMNLQVVEPDADIFYASLHTLEWHDILERMAKAGRGLNLIIGKDLDDTRRSVNAFYYRRGAFLSAASVWFRHSDNPKIQKVYGYLSANQDSGNNLGFFDDEMFGLAHGCQSVMIGRRYVRKDAELPEDLANAPVFIIGSGASVDADLPAIRRWQDFAVIVACGSAFEALYNAGVKPDFYCCTERVEVPAESLQMIPDQSFFSGVTCLGAEVLHPKVLSFFSHSAQFLKAREPFAALATSYLPGMAKAKLIYGMNPLVGNLGLAACVLLGFRRLYLFGMDCAKLKGAQTLHSVFSTVYQATDESESDPQYQGYTKIVQGNFRDEVLTGGYFLDSIYHLEAMLSVMPDTTVCYNCSDGAYIRGAKPLHSSEIDFTGADPLQKQNLAERFAQIMTFVPEACTREEVRSYLLADKFSQICDALGRFFDHRPKDRVGVFTLLQTVRLTMAKMQGNLATRFFIDLIVGEFEYFFTFMLKALYSSAELKKCLEDVNYIIDVLLLLLEDMKAAYAFQPDYVLGFQDQLWHGKLGLDHPGFPAPAACYKALTSGRVHKDLKSKFEKQIS